MAKKRVKIEKSLCIGCGTCVGLYADDYKISDDGLAETITDVAEEEAANVCPVGAIVVDE